MSSHDHDIPGTDMHWNDDDGNFHDAQTVYDENDNKVDGAIYNPDTDTLTGADRDD